MGTGWAGAVGVPPGPEQELCTSSSFWHLSHSCLRQGHLKPWSPGPHPNRGGSVRQVWEAVRSWGSGPAPGGQWHWRGGGLPGHTGRCSAPWERTAPPGRESGSQGGAAEGCVWFFSTSVTHHPPLAWGRASRGSGGPRNWMRTVHQPGSWGRPAWPVRGGGAALGPSVPEARGGERCLGLGEHWGQPVPERAPQMGTWCPFPAPPLWPP